MSDAWYQELKTSCFNKGVEYGFEKGITEGVEKNKQDSIEILMRNTGWTREQAIEAFTPSKKVNPRSSDTNSVSKMNLF